MLNLTTIKNNIKEVNVMTKKTTTTNKNNIKEEGKVILSKEYVEVLKKANKKQLLKALKAARYIIKVIEDAYKSEHRVPKERLYDFAIYSDGKIFVSYSCNYARVIRRIHYRLERNFSKHYGKVFYSLNGNFKNVDAILLINKKFLKLLPILAEYGEEYKRLLEVYEEGITLE